MLDPLPVDNLAIPSFWDVRAFGTTTSTNEVVKDAMREGAEEGFCATALKQTGGYGRQGRPWVSPVGGLYTSVCLRPNVVPDQLPTLSLVASLALYHALLDCAPLSDLAVKWPNDLLVGSDKICGISLEALAGGVCIGIGVNAFRNVAAQGVGGKYHSAYLFEGEVGADLQDQQRSQMAGLLQALLVHLEQYYHRWCEGGFAAVEAEYSALMAYRNCSASMETIDGGVITRGIIRGVDSYGRLLLETDGRILPAASGEVHITALKQP